MVKVELVVYVVVVVVLVVVLVAVVVVGVVVEVFHKYMVVQGVLLLPWGCARV